uniref:Protein kinase domain-containing protein n=1 Tax=Magallana gigas TaxID=29159 RepID=A0A8W8N4L2_MAGGI
MDDHAYAIQHKIDDGAFGEVLCVKDTKTNQILAMKQILYRGDISKDPYIMNEIYSLSHLHHENLLSAVDFCHRNNIAHRDITPCNILLTNKMSVRLADFGLSVPCRDSEGRVILCDDYLGHIHYSAPEVLKKTPYDPLLSDIWSVGVVLYFMIHANVPFTGDEEEIIFQQTDDNIITDLINRENEKGERYAGQYMTFMRNVLRGDPNIRCRTSNLLIMMNIET